MRLVPTGAAKVKPSSAPSHIQLKVCRICRQCRPGWQTTRWKRTGTTTAAAPAPSRAKKLPTSCRPLCRCASSLSVCAQRNLFAHSMSHVRFCAAVLRSLTEADEMLCLRGGTRVRAVTHVRGQAGREALSLL